MKKNIIIFVLVVLLIILIGFFLKENKSLNIVNKLKGNSFFLNKSCDKDNIYSQWIKLIEPVGGEVFHVGEKVKVKWTSCNISESEKITARIRSDKPYPDYWFSAEFNLGVNDGEEEITIPKEVSNPNVKEKFSSDKLVDFNLSVFIPGLEILPKNINCPNGPCMPSPTLVESQTNTPFKVLP